MSSSSSCPECGGAEIDKDPSRGNSVCVNCGTVLEEAAIVSDVAFQETGAGGHSLIGQFVSADGPQRVGIGGSHGFSGRESRQATLQNGKQKIYEVGGQLQLSEHCKNTAFNFYKMAVTQQLTRGRRTTHVIAACLYMTCRLEGTPHLLLDFSDKLRVNVYELGRVLTFLTRNLYINLPATDPCLYVMRFGNCLQLGHKEHEVSTLALRLVQRMQKDWIAIGRRPSGICGAALLMAARYHKYNRTVSDIVKVVNVGEAVVRKRLLEFENTPTSALTLEEFQDGVDLEEEADPPSFREARLKAKQDTTKIVEALHNKMEETTKLVEVALEQQRRKPRGRHVGLAASTFTDDPELAEAEQFIQNEIIDTAVSRGTSRPPIAQMDKYRALQPTLESLGIRSSREPPSEPAASASQDSADGELNLDGIDDEEIEGYIYSEPEYRMKERIWMAANGGFLKEMEEKRRLKEEEAKEKQDSQKRKPPRRKRKAPDQQTFASTAEAIEKVIQEKKISSKINYEVLRSLVTPEPQVGAGDRNPKAETGTLDVKSEQFFSKTPALAGRARKRFKPTIPASQLKRQSAPTIRKVTIN